MDLGEITDGMYFPHDQGLLLEERPWMWVTLLAQAKIHKELIWFWIIVQINIWRCLVELFQCVRGERSK